VLTWSSLLDVEGDALETHYRHILETLAKERGMLSVIFRSRREGRRRGTVLYARPLIQAIVDVMRPAPGQTIHDPACGTGGFMLIAHDYVSQHHELDRNQKKQLKLKALSGVELVDSVARLCVINLYLHGVGGEFTRSNGKPVCDFRGTWKNACFHAGVPDLLFHDLRRTGARNLRRARVTEGIIMKIGGWRTRSLFERYAIVRRSDMNDAILKLQESENRVEQERLRAQEQQEQIRAQIGHNETVSPKPTASRAVN
jgi:hypothetical protein